MVIYMWERKSSHVEVTESVLASVTISTLITFTQAIGVYSLLDFNFPPPLKRVIGLFSVLLFDTQPMRLTCMIPESMEAHFGIQLLLPAFLECLILSWYIVSRALAFLPFSRLKPFSMDAVLSTSGILVMMFLVAISLTVLNIFQCSPNPCGLKTVQAAPYVVCFEGDKYWITAAAALCFACLYVVLPVSIYVRSVVLLPKYITDKRFAFRYKWVYFKFHPKAWWFGAVQALRSLALGLVPIIGVKDNFLQFILMSTIVIVFTVAHLLKKPYLDPYANHLDTFENVIFVLVLQLSTWFLQQSSAESFAAVEKKAAHINPEAPGASKVTKLEPGGHFVYRIFLCGHMEQVSL